MRVVLLAALAGLVLSCSALAGGKTGRYGVALDSSTYPQATPKEALASVLKAASKGKFDYLVAQLADPTFVDDRVKRLYGGKFADQVDDTRARLDPSALKQLKRYLDAGQWTIEKGKGTATVRLAGIKDRIVQLVRRDGRWYLEHRDTMPDE
jgi:hypothetical protein